ncbi:shikimate dehydrogenase (NADP(+)) OS=Castellaniella defragrans OX=75697 GN=HNR28_000940 PE=4 SV=1 [Castellaniella defragrans]
MEINGATRIFAIIGDPIVQAKTPAILNPLIERAGVNAVLVPLRIVQNDFERALPPLMRLGNLDGLVVTYPFKGKALRHVDRLSDRAREIGGINAMRRDDDGHWTGDMFDGIGLLRAVGKQTRIPGAKVLLVGAGGAGSAIGFAFAEAGAASISIHNLDRVRAETLARKIKQAYPGCQACAGEPPRAAGHTILINATPVGILPGDDRLPADFGPLSSSMTVVDIVPSPHKTALLVKADEAGARQVPGSAMTKGQAEAILDFFGIVPHG